MLILIKCLTASFLLIILLKLVSIVCRERVIVRREESSPYECGFEHHNTSRVPVSLRYYFLTLLFLLFDLEIVYLLFLPQVIVGSSSLAGILLAGLFVFVLLMGLIYE